MLLPKAKLEFTSCSTTFINGVFANLPWFRSLEGVNLGCKSSDDVPDGHLGLAIMADRGQSLAAVWLPLAGVGPSL